MTLERSLILAFILFAIGIYGLLTRRHLIGALLSIELMLNAANINFISFAHFGSSDPTAGAIFSVFIMAVSASEVAVALGIIIMLYRRKKNLDMDTVRELHG
jgi:NADH-quinone oxidoreductase subunit K